MTTTTIDPGPPSIRSPRSASVVAIVGGAVGFALVLGADAVGILAGPLALVLAAVLWVAIPSAKRMSRRLALNGAVALGVIPMLWWFPWPAALPVSHSALVLGAGVGFVAFRAALGSVSRRSLLPTVAVADLLPLGAAVVTAWYFRPFFKHDSGAASIALLRRAFGNDNVAHFDMFEMIRRNLVSGLWWPAPDDGSLFAYVPYPQHFHSFAVFASELWSGAPIGSVDLETGLFGIASSLTIAFAFVTLMAAIVSLRSLRGRWVLSAIAVAAAFSFLLLGFGSTALSFGFPPYLFAILTTLIGVVIAMDSGVARNTDLAAVGASVVAVSHSWSLLTPIVGVAALLVAARLPWGLYRARARTAIPAALIVLGSAAGTVFALYLVFAATSTVGSPDAVLATGGAIPTTSIPVAFGLAVALLGVTLLMLARTRTRRPLRGRSGAFVVLAVVGLVAAAEAGALIAVQLLRSDELSYFQYKFVNAIFLVLLVLLVLAVVLAVAIETRGARWNGRPLLLVVGGAAVAVALLLASGVPVSATPELDRYKFPGLQFRFDLENEAQHPTDADARLVEAASVMATWPCDRPIYIGGYVDDQRLEESNQWAMSLSSTWTEESADINRYLYSRFDNDPFDELDAIITTLLDESDGRCVVVAPAIKAGLDDDTLDAFDARIVSW